MWRGVMRRSRRVSATFAERCSASLADAPHRRRARLARDRQEQVLGLERRRLQSGGDLAGVRHDLA